MITMLTIEILYTCLFLRCIFIHFLIYFIIFTWSNRFILIFSFFIKTITIIFFYYVCYYYILSIYNTNNKKTDKFKLSDLLLLLYILVFY